jgi:hypothetical protein
VIGNGHAGFGRAASEKDPQGHLADVVPRPLLIRVARPAGGPIPGPQAPVGCQNGGGGGRQRERSPSPLSSSPATLRRSRAVRSQRGARCQVEVGFAHRAGFETRSRIRPAALETAIGVVAGFGESL